ncbi:N-acetylmuramoyl-L-alanine amidase [Promicromonospora umidemergens]|uniref:N-acetylmuramoyl-L-alanine amidase n=1 Tax=Promicromonospora umidemergens TaxID=629679 RepID=A0ABP8Y4D9_9MICO|nr:N-acetylmuramoyl-L-alanine amidase [Promicromonospora umidemergens]MCP2282725.1 N-acetylmuramoyl-L-alanine amidase [Promicromonospora umidemergens]
MTSRRRTTALATAAGLLLPLIPLSAADAAPTAATDDGVVVCAAVRAAGSLDEAFSAAAEATGVPADLLKGVSYMESRWDQHAGQVSADGGYGVFNLDGGGGLGHAHGDGLPLSAVNDKEGPAREGTPELARAAALTGLDEATLKSDAQANVCGGAALLASYQAQAVRDGAVDAEPAATTSDALAAWEGAVARMSDVQSFAAQVYETLRQGAGTTTPADGAVVLTGNQDVVVPRTASTSDPEADCPEDLGCEWLPAPYEKASPDLPGGTGDYGNHDQADRTGAGGPSLDYILIHDTETAYQPTVNLVQDPTYLAWNYTLRSSDGHVANHLDPADVGWHAGNWFLNMHSIGLEHEGWAGTGDWYTEAMYQSSAALVRHLAAEHGIPLDRAHVIGHDQVPGILPGYTKNVHWDPGPYWDWDHYFELLGAPIGGDLEATTDVRPGDVVEVRTGYADNPNTVTGCEAASPGSGACVEGAGTNFRYLHQSPSDDAPLAKDPGWKPDGSNGTTYASDVSARVQSGHKLVVDRVEGDWLGVWWAGSLAWLHNPADRPVVVPATAKTVTVAGDVPAPVFGRAYPEAAAYEEHPGVPVQAVTPIEYQVGAEQTYAVADDHVASDYYRAATFDGSGPGDRTVVRGDDVYYQLWLAHRHVFVNADDVELHDPVVADVSGPTIEGRAKPGRLLRAEAGTYLPDDVDVAYQWMRDGEPVRWATGSRYLVTGRDRGAELTLEVTVSAPGHTPATYTSPPKQVTAR